MRGSRLRAAVPLAILLGCGLQALGGCATSQAPQEPPPPPAWPGFAPPDRPAAAVLLGDLSSWADQALAGSAGAGDSGAARVRRLAQACLRGEHTSRHLCGPSTDAEHYHHVEVAWLRIRRELERSGRVPPADSPAWDDGRPCAECLASVSPVSAAACLDHSLPR